MQVETTIYFVVWRFLFEYMCSIFDHFSFFFTIDRCQIRAFSVGVTLPKNHTGTKVHFVFCCLSVQEDGGQN